MKKNSLIWLLILFLCVGCSTTKTVPEGDQLFIGLRKIDYENYEKNDNFITTQEEVEAALKTAPNGALFGSSYYRTPFPYRLWIWNAFSTRDSKPAQWLAKHLGKEPVLMSRVNPALRSSVAKSVLKNHGYFYGDVNYEVQPSVNNAKKAKVAYHVNLGHLFTYDTIAYCGFPLPMDSLIRSTLDDTHLHSGDPFTVASLDAERSRITSLFRNNGYFYYQPSFASYLADTIAVKGQAQMRFQLADSIPEEATRQYYIGKLYVNLKKNFMEQPSDSITRRFLHLRFSGKRPPIRPRVMLGNMALRPRQMYSYEDYLKTINRLNATGLFSLVDFQFQRRQDTDTLDLQIDAVFDKPWDVYVETDFAKRTIGRMGPELKIGLTRKNAFRGGKKLELNLHGLYAWESNSAVSGSSYEYGADLTMEFPRIIAPFAGTRRMRPGRPSAGRPRRKIFYSTPSTLARISFDVLRRPGFYKMHIASGEWTYKWQPSATSRHELSPLDVKYQFMNAHSSQFDSIMQVNPYLKATMSDYFIPQMRYTYIYTSPATTLHPIRWETTVSEAGNITALGFLCAGKKWSEKDKTLFKNVFSQFVKIETDFTKTWTLSHISHLVAHVNAGVIHSFGNTLYTPFSERFYVGGANSIRAFPVRGIGPGRFSGYKHNPQYSYLLQNGDIKLLFNLEWRYRLFGQLYSALFIDAGNVWNFREDYEDEETREMFKDTKFRFSSFFKDMAVGTGVGLRYNLDFLVLRVDWGFGLHLPYATGKGGFYNIDRFKDSQTIHFAIGYPF